MNKQTQFVIECLAPDLQHSIAIQAQRCHMSDWDFFGWLWERFCKWPIKGEMSQAYFWDWIYINDKENRQNKDNFINPKKFEKALHTFFMAHKS